MTFLLIKLLMKYGHIPTHVHYTWNSILQLRENRKTEIYKLDGNLLCIAMTLRGKLGFHKAQICQLSI